MFALRLMCSRISKPRHVGQLEVEDDAIDCLLVQQFDRTCAVRCRQYLDIVALQKLGHAHAFNRIIFDDQEALVVGLGESG